MFDVGIELLCVLLDVELGLHTAGELHGVLQPMPLGPDDTVVEPWAECALLDVEMRLAGVYLLVDLSTTVEQPRSANVVKYNNIIQALVDVWIR